MTEVTTKKGKTVLIRPPGFARRAGETPQFTKRRKKSDAKAKLAKAARRKNRGK